MPFCVSVELWNCLSRFCFLAGRLSCSLTRRQGRLPCPRKFPKDAESQKTQTQYTTIFFRIPTKPQGNSHMRALLTPARSGCRGLTTNRPAVVPGTYTKHRPRQNRQGAHGALFHMPAIFPGSSVYRGNDTIRSAAGRLGRESVQTGNKTPTLQPGPPIREVHKVSKGQIPREPGR